MTHDEAIALKSFDHTCTCGGFAHTMNGRDPRDPHIGWCPQRPQHREWVAAGGYDAMPQPVTSR